MGQKLEVVHSGVRPLRPNSSNGAGERRADSGAERVGLGEESNGEDDSNRLLLNVSIPFRVKLRIQ